MPGFLRSPHTMITFDAAGILAPAPGWRLFTDPCEIIQATTLAEVPVALRLVDRWTRAGYAAAGFVTYEAGPAFDPALQTHAPGPLPLLWFGLYRGAETMALPDAGDATLATSPWLPSINDDDYREAFHRIKDYIARGDTYQVNLTWRLMAECSGDPWAFFLALYHAQRPCYGAYCDLGEHVFCSASPELFFTRQGDLLTCRPMKGTHARGRTAREDLAQAARLRESAKERAENLMIVDMVRNDLARITAPGRVAVPRLFTVEQYDTVWQMTSTVSARSSASLPEIFRALFPCASITGAPKVRTSQIIREVESTPRGIYTGCLGFIAPGGDAQFNVAIRTAHLDRRNRRMEYGVGSGVTWDSTCADEYQECRAKALVLTARRPAFELLETLLWKSNSGYFLLERHLARACASARYFGIPLERDRVEVALQDAAQRFPRQRHRVRCLIDAEGACRIEAHPLLASPLRRWRLALASRPIDPNDVFLYHKTTWREPYRLAKAGHPEAEDVLLWNPDGEITESTIANVVVRLGDRLLTPPVTCGLLAGAYRDHLLATGRITEGIITKDDLPHARAFYLINSVRGWVPAVLDHQAWHIVP